MPAVNVSCTSGIRITDDSFLEENETFSVVLSTEDLDVSLVSASVNAAIVDNDGEMIFSYTSCTFV